MSENSSKNPIPGATVDVIADATVRVRGLTVSLVTPTGRAPVLRDVDIDLHRGEALAVVGESGCGKTTMALTVMRHLPAGGRVESGEVLVDGTDVLQLPPERLREWRGRRLAMVYQDPTAALNPTMCVGDQIAEVLRHHERVSRRTAAERAVEMLAKVRMPDPAAISRRYPHQLSGGQRQRVVIAMALACRPRLLIMDEPTTGLDVSVESEVLALVRELCDELGTSVLFITHNLALAARFCQRVCVLYAGRVVETGSVAQVLRAPKHHYTRSLVRCLPVGGVTKRDARLASIPGMPPALGMVGSGCVFAERCSARQDDCAVEPAVDSNQSGWQWRCHHPGSLPVAAETVLPPPGEVAAPDVLLSLTSVSKRYGRTTVCHDVSLDVRHGEVLGLVGESGSGKSTLAKIILGLTQPDSGHLTLGGERLATTARKRDREIALRLQMVFQHPDSTLNPRHRVRSVLGRSIAKLGGTVSIDELAKRVRFPAGQLDQLPHELSGGLKQRVAIARAFAGAPWLVVCDEPVSALDVSVQASVLNLLADLQADRGLSLLFISHDLGVVRYLADRIAVMYLGEIVETGANDEVFAPPHHPYTETLIAASPTLYQDPGPPSPVGEVPSLARPPDGCRFHTRCRYAMDVCRSEAPPWQQPSAGHRYRCHIAPADLVRAQKTTQQPGRVLAKDRT